MNYALSIVKKSLSFLLSHRARNVETMSPSTSMQRHRRGWRHFTSYKRLVSTWIYLHVYVIIIRKCDVWIVIYLLVYSNFNVLYF